MTYMWEEVSVKKLRADIPALLKYSEIPASWDLTMELECEPDFCCLHTRTTPWLMEWSPGGNWDSIGFLRHLAENLGASFTEHRTGYKTSPFKVKFTALF